MEDGERDPGVRWLLQSKDPSVRYFTLRDVLREPEQSAKVVAARREIPKGARLRALLSGQRSDGGFGVHWYKKWTGAHWRLVSAVELGVPAENELAIRAAHHVLSGLEQAIAAQATKVAGRWRYHASQPGNVVGICSRLGIAGDPRVRRMALSLVDWQWPDGGWNCDPSEAVVHSSFYETLATLWGLNEYLKATGDDRVRDAVDRAAEFFLRHRLFKSCSGDRTVNPEWLKLHYPVYWHYDILQALRVLDQAGKLGDRRTSDALDIVESKRSEKDGTWRPQAYHWRPKRRTGTRAAKGHDSNTEVVDWGRGRRPNEMLTLNALRVLVGSGRL